MAKKFDFLSPGIEIREIDQSFIPAQVEAEGPIIIGRTRKGPANKPVKVRNLDDFVSVFGLPVAGGNGAQGDMWRDGNMSGPTYASYAAQAWLASEESPVTVVRLAGEQADGATGTKAGWTMSGSLTNTISSNSTAYGLFIIPSSSTNQDQEGTLAAVFYADKGALALSGTAADGVQGNGKFTSVLVNNIGTGPEFKMVVQNAGSTATDTITFNFTRNSNNYIRTVFNTNPQLVNTDQQSSPKTYWLGESFANLVPTGKCFAFLTPLQQKSNSVNWGHHNESAAAPESGWVISQKDSAGNYSNLFKFKSHHVGEDVQKDYMIAIESIAYSPNPVANPWGSFTVTVMNVKGQSVEKYVGCDLNPSSPNYIAKKIGDQHMEWNETSRKYKTLGSFQNASDLIYVEVTQLVEDGGAQGLLPAGFIGPVRQKAFTLISGSTAAQVYGTTVTDSAPFTASFAYGSGSGVNTVDNLEHVTTLTDFTGSFKFPSIPMRVNGTDGSAPNAYRAYWGIRPKISSTSNQHDADYCDYLRRLPPSVTETENSFVFSINDIADSSGVLTWTEGSLASTGSDFNSLLNNGLRQFVMPLFGGFEGFNIKQKEPFANSYLSTGTETTNYLKYTLSKALASVSDAEVVPANLILAPGLYATYATDAVMQVADSRKDMLAIIDLEDDYLPSAERGAGVTDSTAIGSVSTAVASIKNRNLDSSYACAYYPWVQINDNLNSQLVWVPPSIAALGAFAKTQATSELWFAPAGFNRGGLGSLGGSRGPRVIQARQRLDSKERDALYEVNINPIATFPAEGVVIFGQKTLQALPSALDRVNVRRLVLFLKSEVSFVARNLLFDQNVDSTWNRFKAQVNPILSSTKSRFGLSDYKLVLDETTTTADLIDRNIMYAKIFIKPARAIEYIVVDFVITKTGADFV